MDRYGFDVRVTPEARDMLAPGEALVLDWHRVAICCAGAGELGLYAMPEGRLRKRKGLVRIKGEAPVYAAHAVFPHLAGHEVVFDGYKTFGIRRFTSNLPGDFGLRAALGRLPEPEKTAR